MAGLRFKGSFDQVSSIIVANQSNIAPNFEAQRDIQQSIMKKTAVHPIDTILDPVLRQGGFIVAKGSVKWFNSTKGFGFIQPDDGSADVFIHISAVERAGSCELNGGQKISYELVHGRPTARRKFTRSVSR